jgi:hypothetical protein
MATGSEAALTNRVSVAADIRAFKIDIDISQASQASPVSTYLIPNPPMIRFDLEQLLVIEMHRTSDLCLFLPGVGKEKSSAKYTIIAIKSAGSAF